MIFTNYGSKFLLSIKIAVITTFFIRQEFHRWQVKVWTISWNVWSTRWLNFILNIVLVSWLTIFDWLINQCMLIINDVWCVIICRCAFRCVAVTSQIHQFDCFSFSKLNCDFWMIIGNFIIFYLKNCESFYAWCSWLYFSLHTDNNTTNTTGNKTKVNKTTDDEPNLVFSASDVHKMAPVDEITISKQDDGIGGATWKWYHHYRFCFCVFDYKARRQSRPRHKIFLNISYIWLPCLLRHSLVHSRYFNGETHELLRSDIYMLRMSAF